MMLLRKENGDVEIGEASAWGGIILGLRALGVIDSIDEINDWIQVKGKQDPDLEAHKKYKVIRGSYDDFYEKIFAPSTVNGCGQPPI